MFHAPEADPDFFGESQDSKVINGLANSFGLAGQYTTFQGKNYNGLTASYDGGHTWINYDVGYQIPYTRYGSYPTPTTWFIAAGIWPETLEWDSDPEATVITQKVRIHKRHGVQFRNQMALTGPSRRPLQSYPYLAAVSKTTDGGKTFTTVYNDTGNFYFNDIDCPTVTDCWAVGESESDSPNPGVRIVHTSNGGANWDIQLYINNGEYSFTDVGMITTMEGWAVGAILSRSITGLFFHTTDGGKTWTQTQTLTDEYPFAIDFYQATGSNTYLGWATALTIEGKSSVLRYA